MRPVVNTTDLSPAPESEQRVEEIQGEDRRPAGAGEQRFPPGEEMDMWCAAAGDPYPMEKNPDEIPMFARFVERGLALPVSNFFKGLL
jgi:hypothetical protein